MEESHYLAKKPQVRVRHQTLMIEASYNLEYFQPPTEDSDSNHAKKEREIRALGYLSRRQYRRDSGAAKIHISLLWRIL